MNYVATESDVASKQGAPVLLKPNGAPIYADELQKTKRKEVPEWDKDEETGQWLQRTVKRRDAQPEAM